MSRTMTLTSRRLLHKYQVNTIRTCNKCPQWIAVDQFSNRLSDNCVTGPTTSISSKLEVMWYTPQANQCVNLFCCIVSGVVVGSWAGVLNRKSPSIHQPNIYPANQPNRPHHRVNNHFLYNHRNKKKGVTIGGRKTPAESKLTKTKPKRLQIKQKPATGLDTLPAQPDVSTQSDSASKSDATSIAVSSA